MLQFLFAYTDYGLLALRLAFGAVLIVHGLPKLRDLAGTAAWMAGAGFRPGLLFAGTAAALEVFGGALVAIGFLVQPTAFLVAAQFVVILATLKRREKFVGGTELDFMILGAALALLGAGGGAFGLDEYVGFVIY